MHLKEPFVYLTNNAVIYRDRDFDLETIDKYLADDYEICYCAWKQEDIEKVVNDRNANGLQQKEERLLQLDSETAIYMLRQRRN